jgi:hypothetical protein
VGVFLLFFFLSFPDSQNRNSLVTAHSDPKTSSSEAISAQPTQQNSTVSFKFWFGLVLAWLLTLPVLIPLNHPNTLTDSADGLLHLYRVVALDHAVNQGVLFSRWWPDLTYGYGLPLFVFYAPLSYYLTLVLSSVMGAVNGLNASLVLALVAAVSGVYLFTGERFGLKAGLLSGVAYVYAPILLLNTLFRGSMPAVWAMSIFPFVFWSFGRLIQHGVSEAKGLSPFLPLTALLLGAALLMHNISNVLFGPFLVLYVVIELVIQYIYTHQRGTFLRRLILPVGMAGLLGVGLAVFFLIPAMVEKIWVQVNRVIVSPDFDFRFHFTTLQNLLSLPQPANMGLLNPQHNFVLGRAQFCLALVGLLSMRRLRKPNQRAAVLFAWMGLAVAIFIMLPLSLEIWDQISLLEFVQHPTRFLSPAAFMLAILAGGAVPAFPERYRFGVTVAGIVLIFITTVPLFYPRLLDPFPDEPTLLDMMAYEHNSGVIGATSFGEYLPIWVEQVPAESPLEAMYQSGEPVERLDSTYLPPGARVTFADYGFNRAELVLDSPEPYQAVFHTFYFPGWMAWIDGQPAPVVPVTGRGLIGVTMPAGEHRLLLEFRETPLRWWANVISLVSLVIIVGLLVLSFKGKTLSMPIWPDDFTRRQFIMLAGLAAVLVLAKVLYLDRFDNPLKHSFDGQRIAGVDVPRQANFGHQVNLLGYNLDREIVAAGQPFNLTAYWQARQPLGVNYSSLAQLVDDESHLYAAQDNLHPGELPATRWQPWGFVQDPHQVIVPPGTPPGDYFLAIGLYDPATWVRFPILEGGDPGWVDVVAIPVAVTKPAKPPLLEELSIVWPQAVEIAELRLLGATPERNVIMPNDFLRIALFWEAITAPTGDYQVVLRLVASDQTVVAEQTNRPSHNRYPTIHWEAGERVRDNHALWIPQEFPAGTYHLQVQLLNETGKPDTDWVALGELSLAE